MQVYSPKQFCHFNMFNFHFFESAGSQKIYKKFISPKAGKRVAIVTDPPFGGMVDALTATVTRLMDDCKGKIEKTGMDNNI